MRTMLFRVLAMLAVLGWGVGSLQAQYTFDHVGGGATGSVTVNGPGSFTLEGGGEDIWSAGDSFDFYHQTLSGDFDIRLRVESLEPTAQWTKAGLMARETLASNSRMAFSRVTPAQVATANGGNGVGDSCFAYRTGSTTPAQGEHEDGCASAPSFFPNNWVRLVRTGAHLIGYRSTNGATWALMGDQDTATWEGGALPAAIQVGLAVSRHSGPDPLAIAQLRNLANVNEDPTTIVGAPSNVTVLENQPATFRVDVAGGYDVFTYQWQENGVNIAGATSSTYTTPARALTDTGKAYRVIVTSTRNGTSATSTAGVLTVSSSPALLNVASRGMPDKVFFTYSEPVSAVSALDVANYDIPGVNLISAAFGENNSTVVVTTDPLTLGTTYNVSVFNVEDPAGNVIDPNPSFGTFNHPGGGIFVSDFNDGAPANILYFGGASVTPEGGVGNSGVLRLTDAANDQNRAVVINDFNEGGPVTHFKANWKMRIGGGTARPADGMSFSFANDLPNGVYGAGEEGAGSGLRVTFDTWDNAGADTAPSIEIWYNNSIIVTQSMAGQREGGRANATPLINDPATGMPMTLGTGDTFADVMVQLDPDGTVDVMYKGVLIFNNVQTGYVPTAGRFGFGGRTGGANDNHHIDDLSIQLFLNLGPVAILVQPQSQTVNENATVSFRAVADGSPTISYQWKSNGVDIAGATGAAYTTVAALNKSGTVYTVEARNDFSSVTSQPATLTVTADQTAPTLLTLSGDASLTKITVNFSEPVGASALVAGNYIVTDGGGAPLAVQSVVYGANQSQVILSTATQGEGVTYTVRPQNIVDQAAGANPLPANSSASFTTRELALGIIAREYYGNTPFIPQQTAGGAQANGNAGGVTMGELRAIQGFPDAPKFVCFNTIWELNTFDQAENFGARIAGIFIPRVSGPHTFYISADDNAELWMSPDADPAKQVLIAREPVWNGRRDWLGTTRRNAAAPENRSAPIELVAGQRYYLESLVKEGGGGDNLAVAVQQPGEAPPANGSLPISGSLMGDFVDNPGATVTITQHPQSQTIDEFHPVTLSVAATSSSPNCGGGTVSYQWQRNGVDIPGATAQTYTTPALTLAENGVQYRAVVRLPGVRANSNPATITVTLDMTPPTLVSVGSVGGGYVGVCFNETVNAVDAVNRSNYVVNFGAVSVVSAELRPDGKSVALGLSSVIGGAFQVEVRNIRDFKGLLIAPTTMSGQVWAQGSDIIGAGPPAQTTPPGTNFSCAVGDVDVVAGGTDIWGTSDEFHFVYQRRAGDFDVKVKLQRLDPANNWAKAGLMARETLTGPSPTIEAYSTPNLPPGTATYEAGRRATSGADTLDWGGRPATAIPNAWLRLKRVGDVFRAFHGTDGVSWSQYAGPVDQPMTGLLYVGLATTSHNTGGSTVAEYRSFMDVMFPSATITIVQRPTSITVDENGVATFSVVATVAGAPAEELGYLWQVSNDGGLTYENIPGTAARNASYTIPQAALTDDGKVFRVIVSVPGVAVISPAPSSEPAELHVITDINPPRLESASGNTTFDKITVRFNEQVEEFSSQDPFAYAVSDAAGNDLPIAGVAAGTDGRSVVLTLSEGTRMAADQLYTVTASGVLDLAFNEILAGSTITFRSFVISCGFALQEIYQGIGGVLVSDLTNNPAYPDSPTQRAYITSLEGPINAFADYGIRISGYLLPPVTGNYNFFMSSDDQGSFFLSTDENPANLRQIAQEPVWNASRDYQGTARRNANAPENRSTTLFPGGIPLTAGSKYYFQAFMKEGGGGDNLSVAWQLPGGPIPTTPIPGTALAVAAESVGADIVFTQQPQDAFVVPVGGGAGATLLNANFNTNNGGFTVENTGATESVWTYGAGAGVGGNGAWYVDGTANAGTPTSSALNSPVAVVTTTGPVSLTFDHRYNFEYDGTRWDGGQLRLSVNGSPFVGVPNANITVNGYAGTITGNNALSGQAGWNGESEGYATPAYIRTSALGTFNAGDMLRIQFLGAWDEFTRSTLPNWVVDNVVIREGTAGGGVASFTVGARGVIPGNNNHAVFIQWERSTDNGATWVNIPGANGATYTRTADIADNGTLYRAQVYTPGTVEASASARLLFAINNPPSFTAGANQTVNQNAGPQSVAFATNISPGSAPYETNQVVSFEVSNTNPSLFSQQPAISSSGVLTYTPAAGATGSAVVTVIARDDGGTGGGGQDSSAPQTFTITVQAGGGGNGCPPTPAGQTVAVNKNGSVSITLTGSDPDGDPISYSVSVQPQHGTLSGTPPNLIYRPASNYCGADSFTYRISDGSTNCPVASAVVAINVDCDNECPNAVITVIPPVTVGDGGTNYSVISGNNTNATVMFSGSQSWDPEGDALTYAWFEAPPPAGSQTPVPPGKTQSKKSKKKSNHTPAGDCVLGKVSRLTLQYTGNQANTAVMVVQKNGDVIFQGTVQPGGTFSFHGTGKHEQMGPEIAIFANGQAVGSFHTGGQRPVGPGLSSGSFLITEGFANDGNELCRLAPPPLDMTVQFGNGVVASRQLHLGVHTIVLEVSDNGCSDQTTVLVEVITAGQAVDGCIEMVNDSNIARKDKRPLIELLKRAASEFDDGHFSHGIDKLEDFIKKVRNDKKISAPVKAALIDCAQDIIDAL